MTGFNGYNQNVKSGHVLYVMPLGNSCYSVINEDDTDNIYKTSPHPANELTQGQDVNLKFDVNLSDPEIVEVEAITLTSPLFCQKLPNGGLDISLFPIASEPDLGYEKYVSYNAKHDVLMFETWNGKTYGQ